MTGKRRAKLDACRARSYCFGMQQVFEFFFAAWPLVVVAVLAFVMIRAARGPKRHDVRSGGDQSQTELSRSGRQGDDFGSGGGSGGTD